MRCTMDGELHQNTKQNELMHPSHRAPVLLCAVGFSWPGMWRVVGMLSSALCLSGCAAWSSMLSGSSAQSLVSAKPLAVLSDPKSADYIQFQKYTLPCAPSG